MNPDTPAVTGSPLPGARPLGGSPPEDAARVRELAHEFEAMFLSQMLQQMRQSLVLAGEDETDSGYGKAAFSDQMDTELARQLSTSGGGGLGIADVIIDAFERRRALESGAAPGAARESGALPALPARDNPTRFVPSALSDSAISSRDSDLQSSLLPLHSATSSAFGWRRDPISGHGRFHKGIDLKASYGQPVPSVAAGTVAFAGTQGGYGLTVVIEHESGIRTRYAHLSALAVQAGEDVRRGQDIGRVGSSGRSTGAHLHFEVAENGRPVDPARAAKLFEDPDGFKKMRDVADSSNGWPPAAPAVEE